MDHRKSKRIPEKNIYFCFIDYAKAFNCGDHNKLWKILKEMGTSDHFTSILRNLYAGLTKWTWNNKLVPNWEKSTARLYIVTLLIYLYSEYIMRNAGLDEAQAENKIARRNMSNLRYANDTTLMAESEGSELNSLLMKVKEESERGES